MNEELKEIKDYARLELGSVYANDLTKFLSDIETPIKNRIKKYEEKFAYQLPKFQNINMTTQNDYESYTIEVEIGFIRLETLDEQELRLRQEELNLDAKRREYEELKKQFEEN